MKHMYTCFWGLSTVFPPHDARPDTKTGTLVSVDTCLWNVAGTCICVLLRSDQLDFEMVHNSFLIPHLSQLSGCQGC